MESDAILVLIGVGIAIMGIASAITIRYHGIPCALYLCRQHESFIVLRNFNSLKCAPFFILNFKHDIKII